MANLKSSKKDILRNRKRRARNVDVKSRMKTFIKHAVEALNSKDPAKIQPAVRAAVSEIDRAAAKGVIHQNAAARKKSTLMRQAGSL